MVEHYTVLQNVSNSMKTVLASILDTSSPLVGYAAPVDVNTDVLKDNIIFDSPGEIKTSTSNFLSLYLYSIRPNAYMTNEPFEVTSGPGITASIQKFNTVMDMYYMITAYAETRLIEYAILERTMQILNGISVLRGNQLLGNLSSNGNKEIRIIPESLSLDETNKLWSIFPGKTYKLSLFYKLTPVKIASSKSAEEGVFATGKEVKIMRGG